MDFQTYREIDAMNWSSLSAMATSPRLYKHRIDHPRPDTPSLSMGRAIHTAILEPEDFDDQYVVAPSGLNLRTKAGQAWKREQHATVLTRDQLETIEACRESVLAHDDAAAIIEATEHERSVTWSIDGIPCKGRFDCVGPRILADLKSTRELARFVRDAATYLYHGQAAWYRDGGVEAGVCDQSVAVFWVVVETTEPYDCGVFRVRDYVIDAGRALYRDLLAQWRWCRDNDVWPGQVPGTEDFALPPWAAGLEKEEEI